MPKKTIEADTIVEITVSERMNIVRIPWEEAVKKFVSVAGGDPASVRATLQNGQMWKTNVGGLVLTVSVPTASASDSPAVP